MKRNAEIVFVFFALVLMAKAMIAVGVGGFGVAFFGSSSDANYYDAYAIGAIGHAVHLWPHILRGLDLVGLYSRTGVMVVLTLLDLLVIPLLCARLVRSYSDRGDPLAGWVTATIIALYPTLFFFSLDIYRDTFMVFSFTVGLLVARMSIESSFVWKGMLWTVPAVAIGVLLFYERSYLGFGFLFALASYRFFSLRRLTPVVPVIVYLGVATICYGMGVFQALLQYQSGFENLQHAGANVPVHFGSVATFAPDLVVSFVFQMLSAYPANFSVILVFFLESVPFILGVLYLLRNRAWANKLVDFLVMFFVCYGTVWLIANANLGTAVRLRTFNYISVLLACMIIYQIKRTARLRIRANRLAEPGR